MTEYDKKRIKQLEGELVALKSLMSKPTENTISKEKTEKKKKK